jgi:hypothetical protein
MIHLPYGGVFDESHLAKHIRGTGRDYIIQGQQAVSRDKHTKPQSLDYWLRQFGKNPNTKQAENSVLDALVNTGIFKIDKNLMCPDSGRKCKGLRLVQHKRNQKRIDSSIVTKVIDDLNVVPLGNFDNTLAKSIEVIKEVSQTPLNKSDEICEVSLMKKIFGKLFMGIAVTALILSIIALLAGITSFLYNLFVWLKTGEWHKLAIIEFIPDSWIVKITTTWPGLQKVILWIQNREILLSSIGFSLILFLVFIIMYIAAKRFENRPIEYAK